MPLTVHPNDPLYAPIESALTRGNSKALIDICDNLWSKLTPAQQDLFKAIKAAHNAIYRTYGPRNYGAFMSELQTSLASHVKLGAWQMCHRGSNSEPKQQYEIKDERAFIAVLCQQNQELAEFYSQRLKQQALNAVLGRFFGPIIIGGGLVGGVVGGLTSSATIAGYIIGGCAAAGLVMLLLGALRLTHRLLCRSELNKAISALKPPPAAPAPTAEHALHQTASIALATLPKTVGPSAVLETSSPKEGSPDDPYKLAADSGLTGNPAEPTPSATPGMSGNESKPVSGDTAEMPGSESKPEQSDNTVILSSNSNSQFATTATAAAAKQAKLGNPEETHTHTTGGTFNA